MADYVVLTPWICNQIFWGAPSGALAATFQDDNGRVPESQGNTSKQVGAHQGVRNVDAAEKWFEENDLEGVAFEYEVRE